MKTFIALLIVAILSACSSQRPLDYLPPAALEPVRIGEQRVIERDMVDYYVCTSGQKIVTSYGSHRFVITCERRDPFAGLSGFDL